MRSRKHEITVDSRGRTSLATVRKQLHERYLGSEDDAGVITLVPAVLVPAVRITPASSPEDSPWGETEEGGISSIEAIRARLNLRPWDTE